MGEFLRDERGLADGLDYLIGEKFINYLKGNPADEERVEFAKSIKLVFTPDQMIPFFRKNMRSRRFGSLETVRSARMLLLGK